MAKSKSGGSRSMLRGRLGSDVYSIGKDAAGKRQQVVRSLAEQVANPQTAAQMQGRAIMSTVMQAVSAMAGIVDHSFNGVAAGQPSISKFIKENYALIKADVVGNPSSNNLFGINKYQEKGVKMGAYLISDGKGAALANVAFDGTAKTLTISMSETPTPNKVRAALGIGVNDYFTLCLISAAGSFLYERVRVYADMDADETITAGNVADLFTAEGNNAFVATLSGNNIVLTFADASANYGIIVSRKVADGYQYNKVVLAAVTSPAWTYDVAIATYPVGSRRFLNGGGDAVSSYQAPAAEAYAGQLTALTCDTDNILSSSITVSHDPTDTITGTLNALPTSGSLALYVGSNKVADITASPFTSDQLGTKSGVVTLQYNNEIIQTCGTVNYEEAIPGGGGQG